ncbi:g3363 [Coccomyxa viridis]|uniref:G3363 protein n=1 Tax=Coccomyxa viridis TaxID=1274662 RepID=A0ABP1FML5_9CHLO
MDSLLTRAASLGRPIQRNGPSGVCGNSDDITKPLINSVPERTVSIFGLQLLYPRNSRVVRATEVLTEWLDATYSAFKVPIGIAIYQDYSTFGVLSCLDIIAGAFLLVAVFIRLNTALTVKREGEEVVVPDGRAVALKYVRSGAVLTDLLTILPTVLQVACMLVQNSGHAATAAQFNTALQWLSVLRLVRLPKAFSIVKAMFVESQGGDLGGKLMGVLPGWAIYGADLIFAMYVLINLMGCLWLFTGITEDHRGGDCWLKSVGNVDLRKASPVDQYVAALHFAMTTMATVGYGDVAPTTRTERIIAMVIMAVGLLLFGLIIGAVGSLLEDASLGMRRAKSLRKKMNEVDAFASARNLPDELRNSLANYYNDAWTAHEEVHDDELLKELPAQLRTAIVAHLLQGVFDSSHLFADLDSHTKEELAAVLTPEVVLPGHHLCEAGDPADCLWILQSGVLEMSGNSTQRKMCLAAPAIVGETAILTKHMPELSSRVMTLRAVSKACMLWRLSMTDLQALLDRNQRLRGVLMAGLAQSITDAPTPAQALWQRGLRKLRMVPSNGVPAPQPRRAGQERGVHVSHSMHDDMGLLSNDLPQRILRVLSTHEP